MVDEVKGMFEKGYLAQVIAKVGRKGGCGKSAGSIQYAGEALDKGKKVALIDANAYEASISESVINGEGVVLSQLVHVAENFEELVRLVNGFKSLVDVIIIDTPPGSDDLSKMSLTAMALADSIVLPVGNDMDEVRSQKEFFEGSVKTFMDQGKKVFIQPNRVEEKSRIWRDVESQLKDENNFSGATILPSIPMCVTFKEVKSLGMVLPEFPMRSKGIKRLSEQASAALDIILKSHGE